MQRFLASHEPKAEWWRKHQDSLGCIWPSMDHAGGAHAYVSRQVAMHKELMAHCKLVSSQKCKGPPSLDVSAPQETSNVAVGHASPDFDSKISNNDDGSKDCSKDRSEDSSKYIVEDVKDFY